ncbi:Sterol 3-beta-glucosyltransferase [Pseudocercospora fuligena]|uniref:Sterol 3-beta-glucosyltransferase n=1 Tax=Pseudocercospora fuligena TaxID=685502 RepID=A0A8H6RJQ6_9PEZI|nr:Sterol 3-beta-glucosyltransferase [Pseudocercospora fuligena]
MASASASASTPALRRTGQPKSSKSTVQKTARVRSRDRSIMDMDLPERFKNDDDGKDVDDGTGVNEDDDNRPIFAQQSMYGIIAATRSKPDFQTSFQPDSESDSDEHDSRRRKSMDVVKRPKEKDAQNMKAKSEPQKSVKKSEDKSTSKHRRKLSESKLVRSFLKPVRERSDSQGHDPMTQSQFLPPRGEENVETSMEQPQALRSEAPVLDRKLEAMRKAEMQASIASSSGRNSREGRRSTDVKKRKEQKPLPQVIADIFQFDAPEEVVAEFPCWYLQNVLLQGFMYITKKHLCFYAYLQKKTNTTIKHGLLGKLGKHSYRYRTYWFVLKADNFSYYRDSAEPYFPLGQVDLRFAISADLAEEKGTDTTYFTITTPERLYQYQADTAEAAKEWVKQLQKCIFRSHNEGDAVKISLPVDNILDVEKSNVLEMASTIKVRVVDNEETFAIDEYFFTFFNAGDKAEEALRILSADSPARKFMLEEEEGANERREEKEFPEMPGSQKSGSRELSPREPVHSTLSPMVAGDRSSPRPSGEHRRASTDSRRGSSDSGRAFFDRRRRSPSGQADARRASTSPISPSIRESSESFVTSSEQPDSSSHEDDEHAVDMSASQMLSDDHMFRGPTLRMPQPRRTMSGTAAQHLQQESQDSSRSSSQEPVPVRIQPPSRQHTEHSLASRRPDLERTDSAGSGRTVEAAPDKLKPSDATAPKLIRGISTPLQYGMTVAGMVRSSSKRMGSYLSSSPKTYMDKWSDAIAGGKRQYISEEGMAPDDRIHEPEDNMDVAEHERSFREHFGLPPTEKLVSTFYCWLHKTVPLYGKIYMGSRRLCFRSLWYGTKTKLIIPYKDILNVAKQRGFRWGYPGLVLVIRGYEELFFDFPSNGLRDDCVVTVLKNLECMDTVAQSTLLTEEEQQDAEDAAAENELLRDARKGSADHNLADEIRSAMSPVLYDDPTASMADVKPKKSLRITCLTIGSRGDVQPYIALCKGFLAEGHKPRIATHATFKDWIERHGIEFAEVGGDPGELMRICVELGMFTPSFLYEVNTKFRGWLDDLLQSAWMACQNSDLLIESPSAMAGIHIAEALQIPYFRAFSMPWTRTRTYPHAFAVANSKMGGAYNYMSYTLFDNIFWQTQQFQVNPWRRKTLGLPPTSYDKLQQNKVPFLYNFSPSVVTPPLDFSDWIKVTGYWFLDEGTDWTPPKELAAFIQRAREDNQKLVYIGFGSVTVSDSRQLMQQVVDAVLKADLRCILSKGWSDRFDKNKDAPEPEIPDCIYKIDAAPHDWLFRQVDAVVHHGGAGTTGASLRAGVPTIIKPFFGDQFFFANRVEDLGVGMHLKKVTANQLGKALWIATHDARMRTKARVIGEQIRGEDGVKTAINAIYRDLEYAKSLIKKHPQRNSTDGPTEDEEDDLTEENWTFVEKEQEAEMARDETAAMTMLATELTGQGPLSQKSTGHSRQMSLGRMVMRGTGRS